MVLKWFNQILRVDFPLGAADLKKNVSFYTRKQVRQKREGVCAI
jgi:hypothetical protein